MGVLINEFNFIMADHAFNESGRALQQMKLGVTIMYLIMADMAFNS